MCALEEPTATNEEAVVQARDLLKALVESPQPDIELVTRTADALRTLQTRLSVAQRGKKEIADATRMTMSTAAVRAAHTHRLDSEIIEAKLQAGQLLTERDSVARDLARARLALEQLDAFADDELDTLPDAGSTAEDRVANSGQVVEEDLEALSMQLAVEMERMSLAEKQLVEVVDEINVVRKRKVDLEEKVKAAQEEW